MSAEGPTGQRATIVVRLTAAGRSAVATVRVEGPRAIALVDRLFAPRRTRPVAESAVGEIRFGRWRSADGEALEEVVVCRRADEAVEIHCHGGLAASEAIMQSLVTAGAQRIEWPAWLERHEQDPVPREALTALAYATTERAAAILLDQLHGALGRECAAIVELIEARALEVGAARLGALLSWRSIGEHLARPFVVVIAGAPNVGKSSLLNALVGYERAIVFNEPGVTRDVVRATTAIGGWPVELVDTAGLRETNEAIEQAGIERANAAIAGADLVLACVEANGRGVGELLLALPSPQREDGVLAGALVLNVGTKADLGCNAEGRFDVLTSVASGQGIDALLATIKGRLVPDEPAAGQAVAFTSRQFELLERASVALANADARGAISELQAVYASRGAAGEFA